MDYKQHKGNLRGQIKSRVERKLYNKRIRKEINKTMYNDEELLNKQTPKQQQSKSPLYGYRKPTYDDSDQLTCNCTIPFRSQFPDGKIRCLRCNGIWYR